MIRLLVKDLGADEAATAGMTRGEAMVLDQLLGDGQPLARHTCAALGLVRSTDFAEGSMMSASSTPRSASVASDHTLLYGLWKEHNLWRGHALEGSQVL